MTYSMYRERDGAGDSGLMSLALYKDALGVTQIEENATPRVGVAMREDMTTTRKMTSKAAAKMMLKAEAEKRGAEMVTRKNLMTGKEYQERRDTPLCCSPASETYWSQ